MLDFTEKKYQNGPLVFMDIAWNYPKIWNNVNPHAWKNEIKVISMCAWFTFGIFLTITLTATHLF